MLKSEGTIKSTVLNYGLIMGGLTIAFTLMLFLMDMHYQNSSIQQWTGLLIMAGSIVFGQLAFKKMNDGFISLGEGMKIGIGIAALGSAIGIAYGIFQGYVLDPDTMSKAMDYAIEQAIQQNPEIGDEIVEAMEGAFEFFANPLISSSIGMAVSLFFGQLAFKKMNDGFISLGEGMKIGIGIAALGSAIGIAYGIFQGYVLDPDTMTKAMDYAIEQAIQQNPEIGDEIVEAMEGAFEFFANPLISSSIGMAVSLFFGGLISLLTGLAVKKNRPA